MTREQYFNILPLNLLVYVLEPWGLGSRDRRQAPRWEFTRSDAPQGFSCVHTHIWVTSSTWAPRCILADPQGELGQGK